MLAKADIPMYAALVWKLVLTGKPPEKLGSRLKCALLLRDMMPGKGAPLMVAFGGKCTPLTVPPRYCGAL